MIRYRIYTENIGAVSSICKRHIKNFTLLTGKGYYQGDDTYYQEDSIVIEHIGNSNEKTVKAIKRLCKEIKRVNKQECVLLTTEPVHSEFI